MMPLFSTCPPSLSFPSFLFSPSVHSFFLSMHLLYKWGRAELKLLRLIIEYHLYFFSPQPLFTINFSRTKKCWKLPVEYLFQKWVIWGKFYSPSKIKGAHFTWPNAYDVLSLTNVSCHLWYLSCTLETFYSSVFPLRTWQVIFSCHSQSML